MTYADINCQTLLMIRQITQADCSEIESAEVVGDIQLVLKVRLALLVAQSKYQSELHKLEVKYPR